MSANLKWDDWWSMYVSLPKELKEQTWKVNFGIEDGWKEFIASKVDTIQIEILKHAPEEIKLVLADVLQPEAKEKLLEFMRPKKPSSKWEKYHPK